jgi:hypothetical protein
MMNAVLYFWIKQEERIIAEFVKLKGYPFKSHSIKSEPAFSVQSRERWLFAFRAAKTTSCAKTVDK